jgi:pimeloyl-ACP methyl ester carboxylesterase
VGVAPGLELHVHRWRGDGVPVLLVHGLASNLHLWDGVAVRLAALGHAVTAVDLRGHGRSDKPDAGYDFTTVTDDLAAVVDRLRLDCPVVAGQSWGANLALELAWRRPDLVRAAVCVDGGWIELSRRFPDWDECARALAPPPLTGRPVAEVEADLRRRHPDWPETGIRGALACFEHRPDGTIRPWLARDHHLAILRRLWEHRPSSRYPEVKVPVLLVPAGNGTEPGNEDGPPGPIARPGEVQLAARALPRCRVQWVPGDHDLHAQHPDLVAGLVHQAADEGFFRS